MPRPQFRALSLVKRNVLILDKPERNDPYAREDDIIRAVFYFIPPTLAARVYTR